jgi:hypothetical protein
VTVLQSLFRWSLAVFSAIQNRGQISSRPTANKAAPGGDFMLSWRAADFPVGAF